MNLRHECFLFVVDSIHKLKLTLAKAFDGLAEDKGLSEHPPRFYKRTVDYLQAVALPDQLAQIIAKLRQSEAVESGGESNGSPEQTLERYRLLWHCAQKLPYERFRQTWGEAAY